MYKPFPFDWRKLGVEESRDNFTHLQVTNTRIEIVDRSPIHGPVVLVKVSIELKCHSTEDQYVYLPTEIARRIVSAEHKEQP